MLYKEIRAIRIGVLGLSVPLAAVENHTCVALLIAEKATPTCPEDKVPNASHTNSVKGSTGKSRGSEPTC